MTHTIKIKSYNMVDCSTVDTTTEETNLVKVTDIVGDYPLKKVKIKEFIDIYNKELDILFSEDEKVSDTAHIYGYPIHIIWNGYIVDIGDGAPPTNALIPALEEMDDEWGGDL